MALKNWKRISKDTFKKKGTRREVNIEYGDIGRGKKWYVFTSEDNNFNSVVQISDNKSFKSKSQALRFAKNYMRKN